MKERSLAERIVAILGVLVGTIIWVVRLLFSMLQGLLKNRGGSGKDTARSTDEEPTSGVADNVTQFASAARARGGALVDEAKGRVDSVRHQHAETGASDADDRGEPNGVLEPSPADTPAPGMTRGQHENIGGIPEAHDMSDAVDDNQAAFAAGRDEVRPLEDEETGAQLSHGIPNLEEPGGGDEEPGRREAGAMLDSDEPASDYACYAKSESDVGVDRSSQLSDLADTPDNDLQGGVDTYGTIDAGDTGSDEDQDAVDSEHDTHVPAAGRGWQEPEDPLAGDPLYGDVESSDTGGEVDLRNDESDDETRSGMHVISSPNEPFIDDEPAMQDLGLSGVAEEAQVEPTLSDDESIDDVTNLDSSAISESMLAADSTGRRIGDDPASGDLGPERSYDGTERDVIESREPGEVVGAYGGSGVDEFADDAIAQDLLDSTDPTRTTGSGDTGESESGMTAGDRGRDADDPESPSTQSAAWASSAGVVDTGLTMPESPEDLQTGSDMSQAEAERIIDADDGPGAPGSRKEVRGEFMVDGSESEAVKAPQYDQPQDAALRDVAAEIAEDIDVDGPAEEDETPGDSGRDVLHRGSDSVDTNAGQPAGGRAERRGASVPEGSVRGDGTSNCPVDYPIKGNAKSRIYHRPSDPSYDNTVPEFCFATEDDAKTAGFRARKL